MEKDNTAVFNLACHPFTNAIGGGVFFMPLLLLGSQLGGLTGIQLAQPVTAILNGLTCVPFMLHYLYKTPNEKVR